MDANSAANAKPAQRKDRDFKFVFQSAAELVSEPAPLQWLITDYFEVDTFAMLFGDAASCKTWLALSMAVHVAAGKDFFGCRVHQGAVFILAGEGSRGLRRRLAGLLKHYEIEAEGLPLFVSKTAMAASDILSVTDVITSISELVNASGQSPALVVIDTVSRNFGDGDENNTQDMAKFVSTCDWIRNEFGCTILLIHHVGHQDKARARGNTTLRGALDAEFRVMRDEAGTIEVINTKAKDFEPPQSRRYVLKGVDLDWLDDDGFSVHSAAIVATDVLPVASGKAGRGKRQIKALQVLKEIEEDHRQNLINGGLDPSGARVRVEEWQTECGRQGINRHRFAEVCRSLEDGRRISFDDSFVRTASKL